MLVIARNPKQKFSIGETVVTIVKVSGDKVTLGIDAPPEVRIVRDDAKVREPKVQVQ